MADRAPDGSSSRGGGRGGARPRPPPQRRAAAPAASADSGSTSTVTTTTSTTTSTATATTTTAAPGTGDRLTSLTSPRDTTLGGATKAKFAPKIAAAGRNRPADATATASGSGRSNAVAIKKEEVPTLLRTIQKADRGRFRERGRGAGGRGGSFRGGRGGGRGGSFAEPELASTASGPFSMGPASLAGGGSRSARFAGGGGGGFGGGSRSGSGTPGGGDPEEHKARLAGMGIKGRSVTDRLSGAQLSEVDLEEYRGVTILDDIDIGDNVIDTGLLSGGDDDGDEDLIMVSMKRKSALKKKSAAVQIKSEGDNEDGEDSETKVKHEASDMAVDEVENEQDGDAEHAEVEDEEVEEVTPQPDASKPKSIGRQLLEDSMNESDEVYFLQLPVELPTFTSATNTANATTNTTGTAAAAAATTATMVDMTNAENETALSGQIGKILLYKNGKAKLQYGNLLLDISRAAECNFAQQVVAADMENRELYILGSVEKRLICVPDIDALLESMDLEDEANRAAAASAAASKTATTKTAGK
ncbi:hypothetical protein GQ42DRAFT_161661 [Ramicandelaber brevisporus]|nr:hypothetical protein GQ42DRAFT_161661 [Ramicandelaber brevisporus]